MPKKECPGCGGKLSYVGVVEESGERWLICDDCGDETLDDEEDEEATALDILADYECPECGPVIDPDNPCPLTEDEALGVLGGDERGFLRCPNDDCDEELEPTVAAALDMLALVRERMGG